MHDRRFLSVLVVLSILWGAAQALAAEPPRNILVIGWDGAQRDHMKEMVARNELPNLVALSSEGSLVDVDVTSGATDTKAGWTQILTGYKPRTTGVFSNSRYQPIPEGYSVFERLESFFGPDNIVTMGIIGKKGHVDNDAPRHIPYDQYQTMLDQARKRERKAAGIADLAQGKVVEENGQKFVDLPGKPWYNASKHMDLFLNGLNKNSVVTSTALQKLEENKDKRMFLFIHFAEPDHAGHAKGENSQEYTDALKDDDACTGKILQKLKDLGIYDQTLVYVVVDHGFNEGQTGHSYAPYVFVGTNDKTFVRKEGAREDIAAQVLKRFGMDLKAIQPALDGIPYDEQAPERKAPATKPANLAKPRAAVGAAAGQAGGARAGRRRARQGAAAGAVQTPAQPQP